jgi:hypothetical protein
VIGISKATGSTSLQPKLGLKSASRFLALDPVYGEYAKRLVVLWPRASRQVQYVRQDFQCLEHGSTALEFFYSVPIKCLDSYKVALGVGLGISILHFESRWS